MAENKYQLQLIDAMSYAANGHDSATDWAELYAKLGELGQTNEELQLSLNTVNIIVNKLIATIHSITGSSSIRDELDDLKRSMLNESTVDSNYQLLVSTLQEAEYEVNQRIERAEEAGRATGFQAKMREILDSLPR